MHVPYVYLNSPYRYILIIANKEGFCAKSPGQVNSVFVYTDKFSTSPISRSGGSVNQ